MLCRKYSYCRQLHAGMKSFTFIKFNNCNHAVTHLAAYRNELNRNSA
jgi:hypothetical protein